MIGPALKHVLDGLTDPQLLLVVEPQTHAWPRGHRDGNHWAGGRVCRRSVAQRVCFLWIGTEQRAVLMGKRCGSLGNVTWLTGLEGEPCAVGEFSFPHHEDRKAFCHYIRIFLRIQLTYVSRGAGAGQLRLCLACSISRSRCTPGGRGCSPPSCSDYQCVRAGHCAPPQALHRAGASQGGQVLQVQAPAHASG